MSGKFYLSIKFIKIDEVVSIGITDSVNSHKKYFGDFTDSHIGYYNSGNTYFKHYGLSYPSFKENDIITISGKLSSNIK